MSSPNLNAVLIRCPLGTPAWSIQPIASLSPLNVQFKLPSLVSPYSQWHIEYRLLNADGTFDGSPWQDRTVPSGASSPVIDFAGSADLQARVRFSDGTSFTEYTPEVTVTRPFISKDSLIPG